MKTNTERLIEAIGLDLMPNNPTGVDFGIYNIGISEEESMKRFGALQWAFKHEACTARELNLALGNGPVLTEIVNRTSSINPGRPNPYARTITTAWDDLPDEDDEDPCICYFLK